MRLTGMTVMRSRLRAIDKTLGIDYGWIGYRCVTQVGAIALIREWYDGPNVMKNFKYMGVGTNSQAESSSDTSLLGEIAEARNACTIYLMGGGNALSIIAEHTYTGIYTLREHGVFNASVSGSLFDRTMFSSIIVGVGTVVEWTYEITAGYGG
jgi:hypothetical protein